jgi:hypothetical protein
MTGTIENVVNWFAQPPIYVTLATVFSFFMFFNRIFWTKRAGLAGLLLVAVFFAFSLQNVHFRGIVTYPDNVPIVGMLLIVFFFTWLSLYQGYRNDARVAQGGIPVEQETTHDKVFTWPDLVYPEFICAIICTAVLVIWALGLTAPLEEPANPNLTPNPSKAPWYFLGLQEMLVYYDPWLAGVVFPSFIIIGLMAIPFVDKNPKGNGYFTFKERRFAVSFFLYGFLVLWCALITLGTFLRGPNWNFFGPYEEWDIHKLEALVNVNLSEFLWVKLLNMGLPANWFLRELPGILLVCAYLFVLPRILAKTVFRKMYEQLGAARFYIMVFFVLAMVALPIKMYLRWLFNLKYIVAIPEFFFNI